MPTVSRSFIVYSYQAGVGWCAAIEEADFQISLTAALRAWDTLIAIRVSAYIECIPVKCIWLDMGCKECNIHLRVVDNIA